MRRVVFLILTASIPLLAGQPFFGTVTDGHVYKNDIGSGLVLSLEPDGAGWTVRISSRVRCEVDHENWASIVTPPYRSRNGLMIDTDYNVTAQAAVREPHEFNFVVNCDDYKRERQWLDIVLWPYTHSQLEVDDATAKLGTSHLGKGRLKVVDSKIDPKGLGKIHWMKFEVDLTFPE
jgi:hypothetical protein